MGFLVFASERLQGDKLARIPCKHPSPSPEPQYSAHRPWPMCQVFTVLNLERFCRGKISRYDEENATLYTQPSLTQPSLIRSHPSTGHLSGDVAMVNMALTCTEKHMLGHVRVGTCTCIMCTYVCMHVHVCVSPCIPSYGRIPVTGTLRGGGARIREVECTTGKFSLRTLTGCVDTIDKNDLYSYLHLSNGHESSAMRRFCAPNAL